MPIIWGAIAAAAGAGISAIGASKQQKSAQKSQQAAFGNAQGYLDSLAAGGEGSLSEMFGSKLDPEAFLYEPVDITQSQLDTIQGNLKSFPSALQLTNKVNPEIWKNDLSRIRNLMPGYDDSRDLFLGATKRLLGGQLPFQDVEDIIGNRSGMANMLGTPGGSRGATLRDLGISRMDAMNRGGSMFQQFIQMAEAISPVGSQMRPQQMFFTPQERLQADILQRSLEQQGRASAAQAEAMPDPAANALANANIGLQMAQVGGSYQPSSGMGLSALGQGLSGLAGIFGSVGGMYGKQAPSYNSPGSMPGYSQAPSQSAFSYSGSSPYQNFATPHVTPASSGNLWSFQPSASINYSGQSPYNFGGGGYYGGGGSAVGNALGGYGSGWFSPAYSSGGGKASASTVYPNAQWKSMFS